MQAAPISWTTMRQAPVTTALALIALVLHVGFQTGLLPSALWSALLLVPHSPTQWWQFFTPALLHANMLHLVLNLFWLWFLGVYLELIWGSRLLLVLTLLSGVAGCTAEWALGNTGVGLSGVVYGFGGMFLLLPKRDPRFALLAMPGLAALLVGWLLVGILLTYFRILPIGNAAHGAGFAMGLLLGALLPMSWVKRFPALPPELSDVNRDHPLH